MTALRHWEATTLLWLLIAAAAWIVAWYADLPYLLVLGVVVGCILVNGLLAELEDDMPGGWNNLDGTETPRYLRVAAPVGRWVAALVVGVGGVWTFALSPEPQGSIVDSLVRVVLAIGCGLLAIGVAFKRSGLKTAGALTVLCSVLGHAAVQRWWHAG